MTFITLSHLNIYWFAYLNTDKTIDNFNGWIWKINKINLNGDNWFQYFNKVFFYVKFNWQFHSPYTWIYFRSECMVTINLNCLLWNYYSIVYCWDNLWIIWHWWYLVSKIGHFNGCILTTMGFQINFACYKPNMTNFIPCKLNNL